MKGIKGSLALNLAHVFGIFNLIKLSFIYLLAITKWESVSQRNYSLLNARELIWPFWSASANDIASSSLLFLLPLSLSYSLLQQFRTRSCWTSAHPPTIIRTIIAKYILSLRLTCGCSLTLLHLRINRSSTTNSTDVINHMRHVHLLLMCSFSIYMFIYSY